MLLAISGSQGSGKTTILQLIKEQGFEIIERKTSRSILKDWNVSLTEVNADPILTTKFQNEISKRKHEDELIAAQSPNIIFTERTHADLFTYALVSLGHNNNYSNWLNEYYNQCIKNNQIYTATFYLTAGHFTIENDGTRGSNSHYSRMVDIVMNDITKQMIHPSKLTTIDTPDLNQRLSIITNQAQSLIL